MNENESDETTKQDNAREPLRLEDIARAYGNRPTTQEAIQLSKLFIRDIEHNDTIITEGDIFVDEVQWNKLMRMLEKYNARQDSPSPPPKGHWSDGLERQRKHKH